MNHLDVAIPAALDQPGLERCRVQLHRTKVEIERAWCRYESQGHATPFQGLAWASLLMDAVGRHRGADLFAAELLDESGAPVLLLPLVREERRGIVTLGVPDFGVSDFTAPLLASPRVFQAADIRRLWRTLLHALPPADVLALPRLPLTIGGMANPLLHLPGCRRSTWERFVVPLSGPAGDVLRRLMRPSTFRDFGKFRRRLERKGEVKFVVASTPDEVRQIFAALLEQRRIRFAEIGRVNLLAEPDVASFYGAAAIEGLSTGAVRLLGLSVDGEWIGTAYGLVHGGSFALVMQTMVSDPEWRKCSPGILVTAQTLEWAAAQGLSEFDFTYSFHAYKEEFGAVREDLFELIVPLTVRGRLRVAADVFWHRSRSMTLHALQRRPRLYGGLRAAWRRLRHRPTSSA